jgi:hypothetical protein
MKVQKSTAQREAISSGKLKRHSLIRESAKAAQRVAGKSERDVYQDTIIAGPTGIGKTHNIEKAIAALGLPCVTLKGSKSMFAFGGDLMLLHSRIPEGQKLAVVIDDCDDFFKNKENINILKGMTGKGATRQFQYNKMINDHMFTEQQLAVMDDYKTPGMHGFVVPTDNIVFIFTTNFILPYESDAATYKEKNGGSAKANRLQDLAAIRGRFNVKDFHLDWKTNWGWIAEVALNDNALSMINEDQAMILLDWMWHNWHGMTETNIRTIEKMAYEMVDYPDEYRDNWEADFLK